MGNIACKLIGGKYWMRIKLKKALLEAAKWQDQVTEDDGKNLSFQEARVAVIKRIFDKYKNEIIK